MSQKTVVFRGEACRVEKAQYGNGRVALRLVMNETGEPMAVATTNLVDEEVGPNQAFIKDYSENSGILEVLSAAGIVKDMGVKKFSGYCTYPLVDVLI